MLWRRLEGIRWVSAATLKAPMGCPIASRKGMLEITEGGRKALSLASGEERRFLLDGDEVVLRGFCERDGFARIGFGECRATITPSRLFSADPSSLCPLRQGVI